MNPLDQAIDKALELLRDPKNDPRKVLTAFANAVQPTTPAVSKCPGCGAINALCGPCSLKHTIGNAAVNMLSGLGAGPAPAQPRPARRPPPSMYQGPIIDVGRVRAEPREGRRPPR